MINHVKTPLALGELLNDIRKEKKFQQKRFLLQESQDLLIIALFAEKVKSV
ncbi:hypothetical protein SAMN04487758_104140 [Enterococcus mundtii]|nr:hypothetical protein SAMN04487758_104140 [Enterococcus mundtii]